MKGPPQSNPSVPVTNNFISVTDRRCSQKAESDGCAAGTDSLNHFERPRFTRGKTSACIN